MIKFYQAKLTVILKNTKTGKSLSNVDYKIVFTTKSAKREFIGKTNKEGETKSEMISENGELAVYVIGYNTPFSKKAFITPHIEDSHIIKIENSYFNNNKPLLTEAEYKQNKAELESPDWKLRFGTSTDAIVNVGGKPGTGGKVNVGTPGTGGKVNVGGKPGTGGKFNVETPSTGGGFKSWPLMKGQSYEAEYKKILLGNLGNNYAEYKKMYTVNTTPITRRLNFKTYAIFQFVDAKGKGLYGINYQVFEQNNSKPIANLHPGPCDNKGFTKQAYTSQKYFIKYKIGSEFRQSELFEPINCVDNLQIHKIIIPISTATTAPDVNNTQALAKGIKPPIIINPHDEEIIIVPPELYANFYQKTKILSDAVKSVHHTNADLQQAIVARSPKEIQELEKRLKLKESEALSIINKSFAQQNELQEVWVVETTGQSNKAASKNNITARYLKKKEYADLKNKRINKTDFKFKLKGTVTTASGNIKIDPQQLNQSLKKLSQDLRITLGKTGVKDHAVYDLIGGLGGEFSESYTSLNGFDVKTEAQWMRMIASAGAEGAMSVSSKGVVLNAEANASVKWTLFEGSKEWRKFFPSEDGWHLDYENIDLGIIRFMMGAELSGGVGAQLAIAGNISVDISTQGTKQTVTAIVDQPKESMSKMVDKAKGAKFEPAKGELVKGGSNLAKAEIKAFAGAQAQALLKGAIEWLEPVKNNQYQFVSIATVASGAGVSAGIGAEGKFQIGYDALANKFLIVVSAHLCWGIGAKGIVNFEVNTEQILSYLNFIKSQLFFAGYRTLLYVEKNAFMMAARVLAYCLGDNHPLVNNFNDLIDDFTKWINRLDTDQKRLSIAKNLNSNSGKRELMVAPPETKGILLYAITRWTDRTAHIFDIEIKLLEAEVNFFPERKTAVINIIKTCLTAAEWENTIQHINPKGNKLSNSDLGKVEGDLVRFLNFSPSARSEEVAQDVIRCINAKIKYEGTEISTQLKEYLACREKALKSKDLPTRMDYLLVRNQDDPRFSEMSNGMGLLGGFEEEKIMASNHHILMPFDSDAEDKEYMA